MSIFHKRPRPMAIPDTVCPIVRSPLPGQHFLAGPGLRTVRRPGCGTCGKRWERAMGTHQGSGWFPLKWVRGIVLAGLLGISIIHCGNAYQPTSLVGWDRGILMAQLCDGSWFPLGVWHLVDDVVPSNMSVDIEIEFHRQSYTWRFGTTCGCALFLGLFAHRNFCFCRAKDMGLSEKYGSPKSSDKP